MKKHALYCLRTSIITCVFCVCYMYAQSTDFNVIPIEISQQGYVFAQIKVNNREVKAMIDLADPHTLQLSSSLVNQLELKVEKLPQKIAHISGENWELYKGVLPHLEIGRWSMSQVNFTMPDMEIEHVSDQIKIQFHAVLGWGYFQKYFTVMDFSKQKFTLYKNYPENYETHFYIDFNNDYGYILLNLQLNSETKTFMLDTGTSISVIDSKYANNTGKLSLGINNELLPLNFYSQDLSMLKDLNVTGILGTDFMSNYIILIDPIEKIIGFNHK